MSRRVSKRRNDWTSERVTVMLDDTIDAEVKFDLAKVIAQSAKSNSKLPSTSYSRMINVALVKAFEKGIDKKIIADAIKENERR